MKGKLQNMPQFKLRQDNIQRIRGNEAMVDDALELFRCGFPPMILLVSEATVVCGCERQRAVQVKRAYWLKRPDCRI